MGARYASLVFLSRFQAELDRLFQDAVELAPGEELPAGEWQPPVDIFETEAAILILAEVAGVAAADLRIEVQGARLLLSGSKAMPPPAAGRFVCMERGGGRFSREIQLLWPVDTHRGRARLEGGLLTIEFPRIQDKRRTPRLLRVEDADHHLEVRRVAG